MTRHVYTTTLTDQAILMSTLAASIGDPEYSLEVYSLEKGELVEVIEATDEARLRDFAFDWADNDYRLRFTEGGRQQESGPPESPQTDQQPAPPGQSKVRAATPPYDAFVAENGQVLLFMPGSTGHQQLMNDPLSAARKMQPIEYLTQVKEEPNG